MSIKRFMLVLIACLTLAAIAMSASAQVFSKGTKIYTENGKKVICTLPKRVDLAIMGECKINGVKYLMVHGKGRYDDMIGYIKKGNTEVKDRGAFIYGTKGADMVNSKGKKIAHIACGTIGIFYRWEVIPKLGGTVAYCKFNGKKGYIGKNHVDVEY